MAIARFSFLLAVAILYWYFSKDVPLIKDTAGSRNVPTPDAQLDIATKQVEGKGSRKLLFHDFEAIPIYAKPRQM